MFIDFLASLYLINNLLKVLSLLIQIILLGILASLHPLLFPVPVCLPSLFSSILTLALVLECIASFFLMMKESLINFLIALLEFPKAISFTSLGSIQIFPFP